MRQNSGGLPVHRKQTFVQAGAALMVAAFLAFPTPLFAPPAGPAKLGPREPPEPLPTNQLRDDFNLQALAQTARELAHPKTSDEEFEEQLLTHLTHLRRLEAAPPRAVLADDDTDSPDPTPPRTGGPRGPARLYRDSEVMDSKGGTTTPSSKADTKAPSPSQPPAAPPTTTAPSVVKREGGGGAKKRSGGGPAGPARLLDENLVRVGRDVERFVDSGLRGADLRQAVTALLKQRGLL